MNDEKLRLQLGKNIAAFRKSSGMTQVALGEKINFSDKAVSKWERGESLPDLPTLLQLAAVFDVTVDDLLKDPYALPEDVGAVERVMEKAVERTLKRKADKRIIGGLCAVLVWFVAMLSFVLCASFGLWESWLAFVYAGPVTCLVLLCLYSAWRDYRRNKILISGMMWGVLASVYLTVLIATTMNMWMLFLLGIPGQAAIILWFRLFRKVPAEEKNG